MSIPGAKTEEQWREHIRESWKVYGDGRELPEWTVYHLAESFAKHDANPFAALWSCTIFADILEHDRGMRPA